MKLSSFSRSDSRRWRVCSHPGTPAGGVHPSLWGMRVSVLDRRLARASLVVRDLLHYHLLVVAVSLRVVWHTGWTAWVGVSVEGVGPVGA